MENFEEAWKGFKKGKWNNKIDVSNFIKSNYKPYEGDESFLEGPTEKTTKLWNKISKLIKKEMDKGGVLDADTKIVSNITSHDAGYIDKDLEIIVGLQTDKPLK